MKARVSLPGSLLGASEYRKCESSLQRQSKSCPQVERKLWCLEALTAASVYWNDLNRSLKKSKPWNTILGAGQANKGPGGLNSVHIYKGTIGVLFICT